MTTHAVSNKQWRFPHANDWCILNLPEQVIDNHGVDLTGFNIKADDDGFIIVLKGVKGGKPVVAFSGGRTWQDAVELLCYEAAHNSLQWKPDRYAK